MGSPMMLSVHFSYGSGLTFSSDLARGVEDLVRMEAAGLDAAWVGESYWLDSPTMLGYLAARTSRLKLGSSIVSVYSRSAASIAQLAAGLDYVSGGRAILGLGTSGPKVAQEWHDTRFEHPVTRLARVMRTCRFVLRREPIPLYGGGQPRGLRLMHKPVREVVPIYLAAMGPKSVELAAAEADGWLTNMFLPECADDVWGEALRRGQERRPPDAAPLQVVAGGMVAIDDDTDRWIGEARRRIAFYVGAMGPPGRNYYYNLVVRYGFADAAEKIQRHVLSKQLDQAADAVPDELVRHTNLIGSASFVRERVEAYRRAGVTMLNVVPVAGDPATVVRTLAGWVR